MKKRVMKTVTVVGMVLVVMGLVGYEVWSITDKEYRRQLGIAEAVSQEIELGLNMVKVAVQTEDVELYENNLVRIFGAMEEIRELGMIREEYGGYLESLGEYMGILESKAELLAEMRNLKEEVGDVVGVIRDEFGDKDTISREKVKEAKGKIVELKVNVEKYAEEEVRATVGVMDEMLEKMAEKAGELADCVDNCYKDKIKSVNDGLAEVLKEFADKATDMNARIVGGFELEKMGEIKNK